MPEPRVLFIHLSTFGVRSPFLQNLAAEGERQRVRFRFVTLSPDAHDHAEELSATSDHRRIRVPALRFLPRWLARPLKLAFFMVRLFRLAARWRPHVLAGNWGGGFALASLLRTLFFRRARLLYRAHEFIRPEDIGDGNPIRSLRPILRYERRAARKADLVIIPDPIRARYQAPYLAVSDPLIVRNTPLLRDGEEKDTGLAERIRDIREETPGCVLLILAGTISAGTKAVGLVRSCIHWPEHVLCALVGTPAPEVQELLDSMPEARDHFRPLGRHPYPAVHPALREADAGVVFYAKDWLNEELCAPAKLYEYMKAGIAVLASDQETLTAVVGEHQLGVTADADDPESIGRAVCELAASPARLREMGERGRGLFETRWHFEEQARPLFEWIHAAARESRE